MFKLNHSTRYIVALFTLLSSTYALSSPSNDTVGEAVHILSQVPDSSHVKYYNADYWGSGEEKIPTLASLHQQVIEQEQHVLVDFSQIIDTQKRNDVQTKFRKAYGISFTNNFIIITEHKGELLFTPFDQAEDANIQLLDAREITHKRRAISEKMLGSINEENSSTLPHVSFYLSVNRKINDEECIFANSTLWGRGERPFCKDANISLIYRVNLERSLKYGSVGAATPDAKIVRISLDEETAGAGIHLNDSLSYRWFKKEKVVDGYFQEWSSDAMAQDYRFEFNTSNNKAQILKTFPNSNTNSKYEHQEISGFTLGVTAEAEADKAGPKVKLGASASYNQSRGLTYDTHDYRIERNTKSAQNVSFTWNRQEYATAESLLNRSTDPVWTETYPADLKRINPISYLSFVPNMDVIYKASAQETGITNFTIDSSVNIRPIYHVAYKHYIVFGAWQHYAGVESTHRRITQPASFTVDWEHPVFTGGRPVNLQLASFNSRCVESASNGSLSSKNCDGEMPLQSFIYDQFGRYVSAANTKLCLDGEALDALQTCNQSLSQRWEWTEGTDELNNVFSQRILGHNKVTGELGLFSSASDRVSLRTITAFTNVFSPFEGSPVFGFAIGQPQRQPLGQEGKLYVRSGGAIDAIGTDPDLMVGGDGGSLHIIDLFKVKSITATSGNYSYGGSERLIALTFNYEDGSHIDVGSKAEADNMHTETYVFLSDHKIKGVNIWADNWLVQGLQFQF